MDKVLKIEQSWRGQGRGEESELTNRVLLFMQALERHVEGRANDYSDLALRHIFLMNNLWYMRTRSKKCELGPLLGEQWVTEQRQKKVERDRALQKRDRQPTNACCRRSGVRLMAERKPVSGDTALNSRSLCAKISKSRPWTTTPQKDIKLDAGTWTCSCLLRLRSRSRATCCSPFWLVDVLLPCLCFSSNRIPTSVNFLINKFSSINSLVKHLLLHNEQRSILN